MSYPTDIHCAPSHDFDAYDAREDAADAFAEKVRAAAVELDNSAFRKLEECLHEIAIVAAALPVGSPCKAHLIKMHAKYRP